IEVAYALADIINREMKALVAAGATFIQVDEPSYAVHAHSPKAFVDLFNETVKGVKAKIGVHLCFGNFVGRPRYERPAICAGSCQPRSRRTRVGGAVPQ